MVACKECQKEFETKRQLVGHMRMHGKSNGGYSTRRTDRPDTYECIQCGTEVPRSNSKSNKYCNNVCKGQWEYENIHVPLIFEGKKNFHSGPLKRFIFERDSNKCTICGLSDVWNNIPLKLQIDHIDGNRTNNFPSNLRLICPNCHTQTETWGNKGV